MKSCPDPGTAIPLGRVAETRTVTVGGGVVPGTFRSVTGVTG